MDAPQSPHDWVYDSHYFQTIFKKGTFGRLRENFDDEIYIWLPPTLFHNCKDRFVPKFLSSINEYCKMKKARIGVMGIAC